MNLGCRCIVRLEDGEKRPSWSWECLTRRAEALAEIARPDVGVVTLVAPVHLEFFTSLDDIALAKRD